MEPRHESATLSRKKFETIMGHAVCIFRARTTFPSVHARKSTSMSCCLTKRPSYHSLQGSHVKVCV